MMFRKLLINIKHWAQMMMLKQGVVTIDDGINNIDTTRAPAVNGRYSTSIDDQY